MTLVPPHLLAQFDLFAGLDPGALAAIAAASTQREVPEREAFFLQGSEAVSFYVLATGRVRLSQVTPDGQQVVVRFITPGEGFGIVAALEGGTYPLTAEAVEASAAYSWAGGAYKDLMARHPELGIRSLAIVAQRMREVQDRNRELATERVERRVARALLRLAGQSGSREDGAVLINLALSHQDLAELTGTTIYTISRIVGAWEAAGIVDTGRKRVAIRQLHALAAIAEDLPPAG